MLLLPCFIRRYMYLRTNNEGMDTFIIRTNEVILNKVIITYVHNTYEQINNNISK